MSSRRRAVMLLLVLCCLALLAALSVPLATLSGTSVLESAHRANTLRHRLAVDSAVTLIPELLAKERLLARELDRFNRTQWAFDLEQLHVEVLLQDDTAKLPLPLLAGQREPESLMAALGTLRGMLPLPQCSLRSAPIENASHPSWTGCLDDLFDQPDDGALYGTPQLPTAWVQYLSPLGRTVHAYRADPAVLEAALADLRPGLGSQLAQARQRQARPNLDELVAGLEVPESVRRAARERLVAKSERYSLLIRTRLGDDVRQHYVLCTTGSMPEVVLDWEVAP